MGSSVPGSTMSIVQKPVSGIGPIKLLLALTVSPGPMPGPTGDVIVIGMTDEIVDAYEIGRRYWYARLERFIRNAIADGSRDLGQVTDQNPIPAQETSAPNGPPPSPLGPFDTTVKPDP